jgi:hypothetical protein
MKSKTRQKIWKKKKDGGKDEGKIEIKMVPVIEMDTEQTKKEKGMDEELKLAFCKGGKIFHFQIDRERKKRGRETNWDRYADTCNQSKWIIYLSKKSSISLIGWEGANAT